MPFFYAAGLLKSRDSGANFVFDAALAQLALSGSDLRRITPAVVIEDF